MTLADARKRRDDASDALAAEAPPGQVKREAKLKRALMGATTFERWHGSGGCAAPMNNGR